MRVRLPGAPHDRGFTLIESMVAILVFSTTMIALPAMVLSTMDANRGSRARTAATVLALEKIEELRSWTKGDLDEETQDDDTVTSDGAGATFSRSWSVEDGPAGSATRQATVTVSWTDRGPRSVVLRTLIRPL